jgi:uncharacterized membrane protein
MNVPPLSLLSDGEGFAISMILTILVSMVFIGMPIFCIIRNIARSNREADAPPGEAAEEKRHDR